MMKVGVDAEESKRDKQTVTTPRRSGITNLLPIVSSYQPIFAITSSARSKSMPL